MQWKSGEHGLLLATSSQWHNQWLSLILFSSWINTALYHLLVSHGHFLIMYISRQIQNTSRQNRKPHAKNKNLTKTSQQKQNTSQQNQKPHSKTKDLTAKTKYLTAKANTHGKTKAILLLLWSIWFCREVFCFCREVFGFAVMFLFLPWQLWATIFQRYKIPARKTSCEKKVLKSVIIVCSV